MFILTSLIVIKTLAISKVMCIIIHTFRIFGFANIFCDFCVFLEKPVFKQHESGGKQPFKALQRVFYVKTRMVLLLILICVYYDLSVLYGSGTQLKKKI